MSPLPTFRSGNLWAFGVSGGPNLYTAGRMTNCPSTDLALPFGIPIGWSLCKSLPTNNPALSGPIHSRSLVKFCSQFVGAVTFRCTWATPQPTPPTTIAAPPRTPAPHCTTRATPRNWLPFSGHPVTSCGLLWGCPVWTPLGCLSQSITGLSGSIPCLCCAPRESRNSKKEPGHTKIWLSWSSRWGFACKQPASLPIRRLSNRLPFFVHRKIFFNENQGAATDATAWQASSITCNVTEIQTKSLEEAACPTRPPTQKGKVYLKAEGKSNYITACKRNCLSSLAPWTGAATLNSPDPCLISCLSQCRLKPSIVVYNLNIVLCI